jgi:N-acetylneuraminic acid mutarotase
MLIRIAVVAFLAFALVFAACNGDEDFIPLPDPTPNDVETEMPEPGIPPDAEGWRWETLEPLPEGPRQETGVAALDGSVYLIGGFDENASMVPTVEAFDTETREWRRTADLPVAMHHANVAAVDGRLYVLGYLVAGFAAEGRVFAYDPDADEWEEVAPMPEGTQRGASAVTVLDGRIIVAGGFRGGAVAQASVYDPATDEWEALPDLPEPLDHVVGEAVDGVVYVIGGRDAAITAHSPRVYAYDPDDGEWTAREPMPTSRTRACAAVIDGLIVVLGGEGHAIDPTGVFPEVEAYDPAADEWLRLPEMPSPRHGTGAATVGDAIFVPGGANVQAFGAVATFDRLILER